LLYSVSDNLTATLHVSKNKQNSVAYTIVAGNISTEGVTCVDVANALRLPKEPAIDHASGG
jgi:hypothetical protein